MKDIIYTSKSINSKTEFIKFLTFDYYTFVIEKHPVSKMNLEFDICPGCGDPAYTCHGCVPLTQVPVYQPPPIPLFLGLQKGPGGQALLVGKTAAELEADKKAEKQRQLRLMEALFKKGIEDIAWCKTQEGICGRCAECMEICKQGDALLKRALPGTGDVLYYSILACKKMDLGKHYLHYSWNYEELARCGIKLQ